MGKYLSKYQTEEDYNNNEDTHVKPHISYIVNPTKQMIYIPKPYIEKYFAIEALEDDLTVSLSQNNCEYCIDKGSWNILSAGTNTPSINKGQTLSFRGNLTPNSNSGIGTFTISKNCSVQGNIMSLLFGDNFIEQTSLEGYDYAFYKLFYNCKTLIDTNNLILPATTLVKSCYSSMFSACKYLIAAPELPATTLANYCYYNMFYGCTGLTTAPELPATTLASRCYDNMFRNCTSLTTAPELPATTLASSCYYYIFSGCTSLTTAPKLPAITLADYCYAHMFEGCTSLTTAPKLPAITLIDGCYLNMFSGCKNLTSAPELPATTLANYCYRTMFEGCTSLTSAPELPVTTLAISCYNEMFRNCTNLTTAPELPATTLLDGCYYYMFGGCSKLNYIKMLATNISATNCLYNWVKGVASSGTFVKDLNMITLPSGDSGIPTGWTVKNYNESKNLITFYINDTTYQAEEGMTWEEWVNSEYSLNRYVINNEQVYGVNYMGVVSSSDSTNDAVNIKHTIKPNAVYKIAHSGG